MNQHILLFEEPAFQSKKMVGIIDVKCNVGNLVQKAFEEAAILCEQNYTISPELHLTIHNSVDPKPAKQIFMVYPHMQLKFILVELFKNAMRATLETKGTIRAPPISVLVAKGNTDITIKVSDQVCPTYCTV